MALTTAGTPVPRGFAKQVQHEPIPISSAGADIGHATGSDAVVTLAPPSDKGVALVRIDYGYRTLATAPTTITASDGTLAWGPFEVPLAFGLGTVNFDPPLLFSKGATVTVTLKDGSVTKDLMAYGYLDGRSPY